VKPDAVKWRDRLQGDVVSQFPAAEPPQLLQQERRGEHCRPGVEGEAVLPEDVGPPARRIEFFQHRDAVAARAQTHGRGETAEAGADDNRMS
jgi:hypothetical protein